MPHVSTCRFQPFLVRGGALDVVFEGSQISPCKTFVCPRRAGVITCKILSRESGSIEEKMGMSGSVNCNRPRNPIYRSGEPQIWNFRGPLHTRLFYGACNHLPQGSSRLRLKNPKSGHIGHRCDRRFRRVQSHHGSF